MEQPVTADRHHVTDSFTECELELTTRRQLSGWGGSVSERASECVGGSMSERVSGGGLVSE